MSEKATHVCREPIRVSQHPCGRGARYEHDGNWYCLMHYPPRIAERADGEREVREYFHRLDARGGS